jgi:hypothetical protein
MSKLKSRKRKYTKKINQSLVYLCLVNWTFEEYALVHALINKVNEKCELKLQTTPWISPRNSQTQTNKQTKNV